MFLNLAQSVSMHHIVFSVDCELTKTVVSELCMYNVYSIRSCLGEWYYSSKLNIHLYLWLLNSRFTNAWDSLILKINLIFKLKLSREKKRKGERKYQLTKSDWLTDNVWQSNWQSLIDYLTKSDWFTD